MESCQDDEVNMHTPAKSSIIKDRGGLQCVLITHHTQFQPSDLKHL